jgi:hypothetical protein
MEGYTIRVQHKKADENKEQTKIMTYKEETNKCEAGIRR